MNKSNLLAFTLHIFLLILFFGCSKENPGVVNETTSAKMQVNGSLPNNSRIAPKQTGSIIGLLVPAPAKASIIAFNDNYFSDETTCNQDGSFELGNLAAGFYMVRIDYVPVGFDNYFSVTLPKIEVRAGIVTNLGVINLD